MKDLEKELEENKSCDCCPECNCDDDCNCTPDNKCCDDCSCEANSNCDDDCTSGDNCQSDKDNNFSDNCKCDDNCDCGDECNCNEDNECCDEYDCNKQDNDECQCGCGEKLEEGTSDVYFKQLLRLQAEFDNYRKRTQTDIAKAYSNGFNEAITEFLPALDSFKMATEYITDPNTLMGIQYIEKGILATLEKMGITVIDTSGKFDPNFHQAIGSEVSAEHESGDIIKECFKGFKVGDKVIRYAQVIVAK